MALFRSFSPPLWEIFSGNLLLLICSLFYLTWWILSCKHDSSSSLAAGFAIAAAFITGMAAIALMSMGINSLAQNAKGLPVKTIIMLNVAFFLLLLLVTSVVFRRPVTSELLIIQLWATLELSTVIVLYSTERFSTIQMAALLILIGIATITGLICYVLYYRLDDIMRFRIGIIPLATDAFVMAIILVVLAVS